MLMRSCDLKPCHFTALCPVMTKALDACKEQATIIPSYPLYVVECSVDAVVIAMPLNGNSSSLTERAMERQIFDPGQLRGTVMESLPCGTSVFLMKDDGSHVLALPREGIFRRPTMFLSALRQGIDGPAVDVAGIIIEPCIIMPAPGDMLGNFQVVFDNTAPFFCRHCNTGVSRMTFMPEPAMSVFSDEPCSALEDLEGINLILDDEDIKPLATEEIGAVRRLTFEDDIVYVSEGHRDLVRTLLMSLHAQEDELFDDAIQWLDQNAWGENEDNVSLVVQFNHVEKTMVVALTLKDEMGYRSEDDLKDGEQEMFTRAIDDWGSKRDL